MHSDRTIPRVRLLGVAWLVPAVLVLLSASRADAGVVRLLVEHRESPAFEGKSFGAAGPYERLSGRFVGEVDPADPRNAVINDIRLAPRAGLETIAVPVARHPDGSSITGPVLIRLTNLPAGSSTSPLASGYTELRYQRPATMETSKALLTKQSSDDGQMVPVPAQDWSFANCERVPFPGEPDPARVCVKGGFEPDRLYQLVFTAKDPLVLGLGLAATRDIVSFFHHDARDEDGTPNPVAGIVRHTVGAGTSQSGGFIRLFIRLGFNEDEHGRRVWDGVNPHIAARLNALNLRFAVPGGAASLFDPGSEGVLWWGPYRDEARGRGTASLLDRCRASGTCPKVMETFGSAEFWGLRMSPVLVGTRADVDIPLPPGVRRYYFPGTTHGGGRGGFAVETAPAAGCTLPANPNPIAESMRALRAALTAWVVSGVEPPPSRYPTLAAGELVRPVRSAMGFPAIPGAPLPDNLINALPDYDFGPAFRYEDVSGAIGTQPPPIRGQIPMLVPRTDEDGNEVGGIPSVLRMVPLGTYLGWNVTAFGYFKGRTCGFSGGFIPFAKTRAERLASGDPRLSLEERYGTHEAYVERVRAAARQLVEQGFLLRDDAGAVGGRAREAAGGLFGATELEPDCVTGAVGDELPFDVREGHDHAAVLDRRGLRGRARGRDLLAVDDAARRPTSRLLAG